MTVTQLFVDVESFASNIIIVSTVYEGIQYKGALLKVPINNLSLLKYNDLQGKNKLQLDLNDEKNSSLYAENTGVAENPKDSKNETTVKPTVNQFKSIDFSPACLYRCTYYRNPPIIAELYNLDDNADIIRSLHFSTNNLKPEPNDLKKQSFDLNDQLTENTRQYMALGDNNKNNVQKYTENQSNPSEPNNKSWALDHLNYYYGSKFVWPWPLPLPSSNVNSVLPDSKTKSKSSTNLSNVIETADFLPTADNNLCVKCRRKIGIHDKKALTKAKALKKMEEKLAKIYDSSHNIIRNFGGNDITDSQKTILTAQKSSKEPLNFGQILLGETIAGYYYQDKKPKIPPIDINDLKDSVKREENALSSLMNYKIGKPAKNSCQNPADICARNNLSSHESIVNINHDVKQKQAPCYTVCPIKAVSPSLNNNQTTVGLKPQIKIRLKKKSINTNPSNLISGIEIAQNTKLLQQNSMMKVKRQNKKRRKRVTFNVPSSKCLNISPSTLSIANKNNIDTINNSNPLISNNMNNISNSPTNYIVISNSENKNAIEKINPKNNLEILYDSEENSQDSYPLKEDGNGQLIIDIPEACNNLNNGDNNCADLLDNIESKKQNAPMTEKINFTIESPPENMIMGELISNNLVTGFSKRGRKLVKTQLYKAPLHNTAISITNTDSKSNNNNNPLKSNGKSPQINSLPLLSLEKFKDLSSPKTDLKIEFEQEPLIKIDVPSYHINTFSNIDNNGTYKKLKLTHNNNSTNSNHLLTMRETKPTTNINKCASFASKMAKKSNQNDVLYSMQSPVTAILDSVTCPKIPGLILHPNDLVWGKIAGYPWWPAKLLEIRKKTQIPNNSNAKKSPAIESKSKKPTQNEQIIKCLISWFGECEPRSISELTPKDILPFTLENNLSSVSGNIQQLGIAYTKLMNKMVFHPNPCTLLDLSPLNNHLLLMGNSMNDTGNQSSQPNKSNIILPSLNDNADYNSNINCLKMMQKPQEKNNFVKAIINTSSPALSTNSKRSSFASSQNDIYAGKESYKTMAANKQLQGMFREGLKQVQAEHLSSLSLKAKPHYTYVDVV